MSKSEGNFYTLRDLLLKGYKASAIRFLLVSNPYSNQFNFTFDGLIESTAAVERLRKFHQRILSGSKAGSWPAGLNTELAQQTTRSGDNFTAALANDLNTSEARAAVFELVRAANGAADHGTLFADNVAPILGVLQRFDEIFAVLEDRDDELTRTALEWAERQGCLDQAAPELLAGFALSDAAIEALIAERALAKRTRNFARSDAIRNELAEKGILIEDSKDGTRWKRK
jgi:cysteinyl-tRNA synthetase